MSVTCMLSHTACDVRCPVCGQGFLLFVERTSATVQHHFRRRAEKAMRLHHADQRGHLHVHPAAPFQLTPEDTMLGNLLSSLTFVRTAAASC